MGYKIKTFKWCSIINRNMQAANFKNPAFFKEV